jgi:hypothetical protein
VLESLQLGLLLYPVISVICFSFFHPGTLLLLFQKDEKAKHCYLLTRVTTHFLQFHLGRCIFAVHSLVVNVHSPAAGQVLLYRNKTFSSISRFWQYWEVSSSSFSIYVHTSAVPVYVFRSRILYLIFLFFFFSFLHCP